MEVEARETDANNNINDICDDFRIIMRRKKRERGEKWTEGKMTRETFLWAKRMWIALDQVSIYKKQFC